MTADEIRAMLAAATGRKLAVDLSDPSDVVIWAGETLIANIGGSRVQDVMVAFDMDAAYATLFCASPDLAQMVLDLMAERDRLRDALKWYAGNPSSQGDKARAALAGSAK